jgi:peroxiredoxin Q/BCP
MQTAEGPMLAVGATAPEFSLQDAHGASVTTADLLSEGPLLLYFYPADFTPICTREACLFRDAYDELVGAGIRVAGISPNPVATHTRFAETHALKQILLADPNRSAIRAYGAAGPFGFGVRRVTYLIGKDGTVRAAIRADLRLKPHQDLIAQAQTLLKTHNE